MELISLKLKNFKVFKNATIDFFPGIIAIIGPNEAGKSTIVKGILFALFGKQAFRSYENLIHFESNRAKITLIFSIREKKYRVIRELRKSKSGSISQINAIFSELADNQEHFIMAKGVNNVDSQIEKIIGFKYSELTASNIIAQKKLNKISKMTPKEWKELFNEFLNLKGFGDSISELKEEKKEKESQLVNDKLRFDKLTDQKEDYWDQFKRLIRLSKKHYKNARVYRKLSDKVNELSNYIRIIKEYIEKRSLELKLNEEKKSKYELLTQLEERLSEIIELENENEQLKENLEIYETLDQDEKKIIEIKDFFETYQKVLKNIVELEKKLDYLTTLEHNLKDLEKEFENYKDIPEQLSLFRNLEASHNLLENNFNYKKILEVEYNRILEAEEINDSLNSELTSLQTELNYKENYIEAENIYYKFKANFDQSKHDRDNKQKLEFDIKNIRKNCPDETPEDLNELKNYKEQKENLIKKGFVNYFIKSSKWNLPILVSTLIIALIPLFLGLIPYSFIGIALVLIFFIYTFYKFTWLKKLIEKLEHLIFSIEQFFKLETNLKEVIKTLKNQYLNIQQIITQLPEYYSAHFQIKENLNGQEYSLNLYFHKLSEKIQNSELQLENLKDKIEENNKLIIKKPQIEEKLSKTKHEITNIRNELYKTFESGFKNKYIIEEIDLSFKFENIDFSKINTTLKKIEKIILMDLDHYNTLKGDIEELREKLKVKPTTVQELKQNRQEKENLFNNIVSLLKGINQVYISLIINEMSIEEQIRNIKPLKNSLKTLDIKLQEDKNKRDKIEAQIKTNKVQIEKKPDVLTNIDKYNKEIETLIETIQAIIYPEIPKKIIEKFDENNPEICRDNLELEKSQLNEHRNQIFGEMKSIDNDRNEIREYLRNNESIIHDFFKKKEDIGILEGRIKVYEKSIVIVDQVNRKIWDLQMPYILSYISKFLPKITMGRYRNMNIKQPESKRKKKYEFKVFEETTEKFIDKKFLSGGTEDQILLVIRVAVAMSLLPQSKGHYPKFLFLDEAFASSDSERRMEILNWLTKDLLSIFSQIIIISHQKEIIEKIPYYYKLNQGVIIDKLVAN